MLMTDRELFSKTIRFFCKNTGFIIKEGILKYENIKLKKKNINLPSKEEFEQKYIEFELQNNLNNKYNSCSSYIYKYYSSVKQQSDLADKLQYEVILKAKEDENGELIYPNLEKNILDRIVRFNNGESLEDIISDITDEDKIAFEQLIKVGIRVSWVQSCKQELKLAIQENREPNYPNYPEGV